MGEREGGLVGELVGMGKGVGPNIPAIQARTGGVSGRTCGVMVMSVVIWVKPTVWVGEM